MQIKLDNDQVITWGDIFTALFVIVLWGFISIIISAVLFNWVIVPDYITSVLGYTELIICAYLIILSFRSK